MSVTDFLFNGAPPASVTTYGVAAKDTPAWYSDYTQGLVAKANAIAASPYQSYQGPRVAGTSPTQKTAYDMAKTAASSYQPYMQGAQMYSDAAGSTTGLAAANPYFSQAAKTLLQNQFIGGGSFGGSRSGEALSRGMRDLQESTMAQQAQALQQGYTQAGQQFGQDQTRLAQMGQSAGTLQAADLNRMLELSKQQATLGGLEQQLGLTGAAAVESIGQQEQALNQRSLDLAYQDFQRQRDDPYNRIAFMNAAVRGLELPSRTTTESTGPANVYQPSVLSQLASAGATGLAMKKAGLI